MSRGDLPRERCRERAVEKGQGSLYHHPEAEKRRGKKGGDMGEKWLREEDKPKKKAFTQRGSKRDATAVFFILQDVFLFTLQWDEWH